MTTASNTNENGESTPLISNSQAPQPYYFLSGTNRESIDEGSINRLPAGSVQEEFASRPVMVSAEYTGGVCKELGIR